MGVQNTNAPDASPKVDNIIIQVIILKIYIFIKNCA